jgi:hypothetical protein
VLESYRIKRKRGHDGHQQTDLCTAATLALATKGKGPSSSRRVQRKTRATRPELEYAFTTRCNYYQMVEVANVCNGSSEAIRLKENFWMCSQRRSQHLNSRGTNKRGKYAVRHRTWLEIRVRRPKSSFLFDRQRRRREAGEKVLE